MKSKRSARREGSKGRYTLDEGSEKAKAAEVIPVGAEGDVIAPEDALREASIEMKLSCDENRNWIETFSGN